MLRSHAHITQQIKNGQKELYTFPLRTQIHTIQTARGTISIQMKMKQNAEKKEPQKQDHNDN